MRHHTGKLIRAAFVLVVAVILAAWIAQKARPPAVAPSPEWESSVTELDVRREIFFVQSGDAQLEAELLIPGGGNAQKAAVIFSPGSGGVSVQEYPAPGFIQNFVWDVFLPRDVAVLLINKRGVGQSTGDWRHNDFQGRADDLYAAVQHLQAHPAIDPARIGLIGHSQGGWIVGLTAAQHDDVAFFISLAGPTTTVGEQMIASYNSEFYCQGYEGQALARKTANEFRWNQLGASIGSVIPVGEMRFMAGIIDYDPRAALQTVTHPGLLIFAENDPLVPPDQNLARFDDVFDGSPPEHLTVKIIDQTNHLFSLTDQMCISTAEELFALPPAQDLVTVLDEWLTQQGY